MSMQNNLFELISLIQSPVSSITSVFIFFGVSFLTAFRRLTAPVSLGRHDGCSQFFIACNTFEKRRLVETEISYDSIKGCFNYPVGFFWIAGRVSLYLINNLPCIALQIRKFNRIVNIEDIFPFVDHERKLHYNTALGLLQLLAGTIFPLISQIIFLIVALNFRFSLVSLFIFSACLILVDQSFGPIGYSISTRGIGKFIYSCLFFAVIYSLLIPFANNNIPEFSTFSFIPVADLSSATVFCLLSSFCISLSFISSQRGFQLSISLLISLCLLGYIQINHLFSVFGFSLLLLAQISTLNIFLFIRTYISYQVQAQAWINKTYGSFRYGLLKAFNPIMLKDFLRNIFLFPFAGNYFQVSSFGKRNILAPILIFRVYIYLLILLFATTEPRLFKYEFLLLLATFLPVFLTYLRPFQNFGSCDMYYSGNYVYGFASLFLIFNLYVFDQSLSSGVFQSLVFVLLIVESIGILCSYISHSFSQFSNLLNRSSDDFDDSNNEGIRNLSSFVFNLSQEFKGSSPVTIASHENHLQSYVEGLEILSDSLIVSKFKLLTNDSYVFFDDYNNWSLRLDSLSKKIIPDLLLLDLEKPGCIHLYNMILKSGLRNFIVYVDISSKLSLVSVSRRIKPGPSSMPVT